MNAILAIDQGTTGSTCLVIGESGAVLGRAYSEFGQIYPKPGWVEHDASEIWAVTRTVALEAVDQSRSAHGSIEIAAVGITNQRETIVVWDRRTGEPVHNAIVWQDRRTADRCRDLKAAGEEAWVREHTGLVLDPYFSATKIEWLLQHIDGLQERAEKGELAVGTIDSWLMWKLSGQRAHVTDPTNASRTLLYNIRNRRWDDRLLDMFGVPPSVLPEVRPSSSEFCVTDADVLGFAVPVAGVAGDQQAALFGQGCVHAGQAKNTYGTGAFLLMNTGEESVASRSGLLTTIACGPRGEATYALEGSIFIAGAAVQWLRDELRIIESADETEAMVSSLAGNDGVYFVPAFVGLGAPHWNPEARGTIVGLTRGSGRAHLVRAALEAMAYSTRDVLEAMQRDSGVAATELAVDGGASRNDWMMQFQSDIVGLPVRRPHMVETTAAGAAALAGLHVGMWADTDAFLAARQEPVLFEPAMEPAKRDSLLDGWRRATAAALAWAESST